MRRLLITLTATLFLVTAYGDDLLECVHPDIRQGLLFVIPSDDDLDISDEMSPEIAALPVPTEFNWLANRSRPDGQTGAFTTGTDPQTALDSALSALAVAGWQEDGMNMPVSAFESPALDRSQTVCRDTDALTVATRRLNDITYVLYHVNDNSERSSCAMRDSASMFMGNPILPQFDYTDLGSRGPRGSSGSGMGNNIRTSSQVRLEASLDAVASALGQQLGEQGWQADSAWSGSVMAGSTWTRLSDEQKQLSGALDVVDRGDGSFQITFTLAELN